MSIRQQKCSAPSGAVLTNRFSGGLDPSWRANRHRPSCSSAAPVGPVVLEARARTPGHEHQLERQPRGIRRDQHGLLVDRDDPLAQAHLFGEHVSQQALAHRTRRVGVCALALAGHDGRHEVQRVQLRVCVRQRGSPLTALVDDQLRVGATRVRAHAQAPHLHRVRHLLRW